jgi:hypothetical protein
MPNDRERIVREERAKKPTDQRSVEALEQIADTLTRIYVELKSNPRR